MNYSPEMGIRLDRAAAQDLYKRRAIDLGGASCVV